MNRIISSFLLLLLTHLALSQEYKRITLEFNPNDFSIGNSVQGKVNIQSSQQEEILLSDTSLPAIPYKIVNVKVWGRQEYAGVSATHSITHFADNVVLSHNPVTLPTNTIPSSSQDTITYLKKIYPDENVIYTGTSDYGDYKILSFLVSPWIYNAREGTLELMTHVDLQIKLTTNPLFTTSSRRDDYSLNEFTNALVINADEFSDRQQPSGMRSLNSGDYEYVVVTTSALSQYFMPLVNWKNQKGVKAKIITMEEIQSQYPNSTAQLSIKSCLYDYYTNHSLKYALLGGDDTIVPVQGCYCLAEDIEDYSIPSDLYYACFSGNFLWNAYNNNIYGEVNDSVDFSPSIFVSRAPVRTSSDVTAFVNKTLNYEKTPNTNGWSNNILMCGAKLWQNSNNYPYWSDAQIKSEALYNQAIAPYWSGNKDKFYDTDTSFGGASYELNSSNLQSKLALGYTFMDMNTHGDDDNWSLETGGYSCDSASALVNSKPTIIITSACHTNAFDHPNLYYYHDPCLSEAFIRNPNSNVVAYLGCSRQGWGIDSPDASLGPSLKYEKEFFIKLFGSSISDKNWGKIVALSKAEKVGQCQSYSPERWIQLGLNAIGDPEMPVFINTPVSFSQASITYSNGGFTINTGIAGCRVCIMSSEDNGFSLYEVYDNVQTVTKNSFDLDLSICITKQGFIPKIYTIPSPIIYIQNETIEENSDYEAERIYVGSNVTSYKPSGNVVIQNCDVTLTADEIVLYPTTEVMSGASLTIENR